MQNIKSALLLIFASGHLLLITACQKEEMQPDVVPLEKEENTEANTSARLAMKPKKIMLAYHPSFGKYLVDQDGRTLYILPQDVSGNSSCLTRCLGRWPVFELKNIKVSAELNTSDFAIITRPDGRRQVTFKGWPLYYYSGDTQPGEVNGDGFQNAGFVAKPDYTLMLAIQKLDALGGSVTSYIVDAEGRTLYFFLQDPENESICYDECLASWPAFTNTEDLHFPSTLDRTKFGVIVRADGLQQLTYLGMPLYYFVQDTKRADAKGQLVENWTVAHLNW